MTKREFSIAQARVLLHAGAVVALTAFLLVTEWLQPNDVADANIGGGGAFFALFVMGLPWSVPAWFNFAWELRVFFAVAGAVVNVGIHLFVVRWLGRRALARHNFRRA